MKADREALAVYLEYVRRTDLVCTGEAALDFYRAAFAEDRILGDSLKKIGRTLSADEKRAAGVKRRGIVTAEFMDTLSPAGRADPFESAFVLGQPAPTIRASIRDLIQLEAMDLFAKLLPSLAAAGPCRAARRAKTCLASEAQALPLPECTHPEQCACSYQAALRT